MKTLTITDAKKNLGKWLRAAANGEEVGILSGSDVIALRKVEVEAVDDYKYAMEEYGATREELKLFEKAVEEDMKKGDYITFHTKKELKRALDLEEECPD